MITSSTASRIASVIARKSSISYDGTPSCVRAWMWIIDAPSSTARLASAAYSSGVYGIAGHWSLFATAPEIDQARQPPQARLLPLGAHHEVDRGTAVPGRAGVEVLRSSLVRP